MDSTFDCAYAFTSDLNSWGHELVVFCHAGVCLFNQRPHVRYIYNNMLSYVI